MSGDDLEYRAVVRLSDDSMKEMREDLAKAADGGVPVYDDTAVEIALVEIVELRARVAELEKQFESRPAGSDADWVDVKWLTSQVMATVMRACKAEDRVAALVESRAWHIWLPGGAYEVRYESGEMTVVSSPSSGSRQLKLVDQRGMTVVSSPSSGSRQLKLVDQRGEGESNEN